MPQVKYTPDGLPYYDATDQQTQPYFPQVSGPMLPAPGNPAQPSEGWNQGVRDTLHGMTIGPFQDAAKALQGGMTDNEAQNFAFGAALGLLPMGRGLKGIKAYHGSPHDFDRFDMSKIGTGEGAQAYGHGLYFAENKNVAEAYKTQLARTSIDFNGERFQPAGLSDHIWRGASGSVPDHVRGSPEFLNGIMDAVHEFASTGKRPSAPSDLSSWMGYGPMSKKQGYAFASEQLEKAKPSAGRMYEVNINAHPDQFLDWDKPVAGASSMEALAAKFDAVNPGTRRFLEDWGYKNEQAGRPMPDGEDIIRELKAVGDNRKQFSREAAEAGIPGIKYLDQGSRPNAAAWEREVQQYRDLVTKQTELLKAKPGNQALRDALAHDQGKLASLEANPRGSRNYVVFDDKLVSIIKKYGWAAIAPMLGLTAENLPIPKAQAPQFQ